MNTHDIEQERQKFEAFMREKNPSHDLDHEFGIYRFSPVQRHWDTWQAAIEADRQARGEPVTGGNVSELLAAIQFFGSRKREEGAGLSDPKLQGVRSAWDEVYRLVQAVAAPQPQQQAGEPMKEPSDAELEKAWDSFEAEMARHPTDDELEEFMAQFADETGHIHDDQHGEAARALLARYGAQPAASAEPVAYLDIGVGGYTDVGTALKDEQLAALPKGRHMLGIIGTYGVNGYREAATQPAEPVKADSAGYTSGPVSDGGFDPRNATDRQARGDLISKYQEKVRALEADNHNLVADADELKRRSEPVYAFRRKGLADFSTCTKERFDELSDNNLFETRIFYNSPQPQQQARDEPVAWWKIHEGKPSIVPAGTILPDDAISCGWKPLGFLES